MMIEPSPGQSDPRLRSLSFSSSSGLSSHPTQGRNTSFGHLTGSHIADSVSKQEVHRISQSLNNKGIPRKVGVAIANLQEATPNLEKEITKFDSLVPKEDDNVKIKTSSACCSIS